MKTYKKVKLASPTLNLYPVYREAVYNGHEPLKVVGVRQHEVELEGDYSGGTHGGYQKEWVPLEECFMIRSVCEQELQPKGCQVHNVNCCGGGSIVSEHVEYWKENLIR